MIKLKLRHALLAMLCSFNQPHAYCDAGGAAALAGFGLVGTCLAVGAIAAGSNANRGRPVRRVRRSPRRRRKVVLTETTVMKPISTVVVKKTILN